MMKMASRILTTILVILGFLIQTVYGYSCTYFNSFGRLVYLHCPYSECCGTYRHRYCCRTYSVGGIVGGVIGFLIFVGLIAACFSCFFCACCPVYQRRSSGYIVQRALNPKLLVLIREHRDDSAPNYSSTAASQPYQSTVVTRTQDGLHTSPPPQYKP